MSHYERLRNVLRRLQPSKELKIVFDVSYCTKGEVTVLRVQQESERVTPQ